MSGVMSNRLLTCPRFARVRVSSAMATTRRLFMLSLALVAMIAIAVNAAADDLPAYTITFDGGRIEPARLEVPANTKIKLVLRNAGRGAAEFEGRDVRVEKVLASGSQSFVVIQPLKPGTYRFVDEFHPDAPDVLVIAK